MTQRIPRTMKEGVIHEALGTMTGTFKVQNKWQLLLFSRLALIPSKTSFQIFILLPSHRGIFGFSRPPAKSPTLLEVQERVLGEFSTERL